jgi:hypothetical protein
MPKTAHCSYMPSAGWTKTTVRVHKQGPKRVYGKSKLNTTSTCTYILNQVWNRRRTWCIPVVDAYKIDGWLRFTVGVKQYQVYMQHNPTWGEHILSVIETGQNGTKTKLIAKRTLERPPTCGAHANVSESFLHSVLHCGFNVYIKARVIKQAHSLRLPVPCIPALIFVVRTMTVSMDEETIWGMEYIDDTLLQYIQKNGTDKRRIIDVLLQVCILIQNLQSVYGFMHRDLHALNVMVKYESNSTRVALVDFGASSLVIQRCTCPTAKRHHKTSKQLCRRCGGGPSKKEITCKGSYADGRVFNESLDLATLLTHLYQNCPHISFFSDVIYEEILLPMFKNMMKGGVEYTNMRNKYTELKGSQTHFHVDRYSNLHHVFYQHVGRTNLTTCTPNFVMKVLTESRCTATHR